MANMRGYFERDARGRERIVLTPRGRRSSSHQPQRRTSSDRDLNEAEERIQELEMQVSGLQTRLSFAERNEWQTRQQLQALINEHAQCRNLRGQATANENAVRHLEDQVDDERDKYERLKGKNLSLKEEIRDLKRNVVQDYRTVYEEKVAEVELLRQRLAEKADMIRLSDTRLDEKDRKIRYLRNYLEQLGYRVQI